MFSSFFFFFYVSPNLLQQEKNAEALQVRGGNSTPDDSSTEKAFQTEYTYKTFLSFSLTRT